MIQQLIIFNWKHWIVFISILSILNNSCQSSKKEEKSVKIPDEKKIFFDDFNYKTLEDFYENNWKIRNQKGHPGIKNATWSKEGISFHSDIETTNKGIIRMTSSTSGTGETTHQTQLCHQRKYLEGTYASRVYFRDSPTSGPDGDEVIQTFYAISPLKAPMDPDYSEADFEYLPNGGWGEGSEPNFWSTTWETFQLEPWTKVNEYSFNKASYQGWHTLVLTIKNEKVSYYIDGKLLGEHGENVYPEVPMSINFNLWFVANSASVDKATLDSEEERIYQEDIDWVFHQVGEVLTTVQVQEMVENFRNQNIQYLDKVPQMNPPLESPCGL